MLSEEQAESSRFFCELAPAKFGWRIGWVERVRAFHVKGVQGVKTGTGGHLPCDKVPGKIAEVRGLEPGQAAISPSTFTDLQSVADFRNPADEVRELSGGVCIGFKLSANRIEDDIDFALACSADCIILDDRGGGTGAAPLIFRINISVSTIPPPALAPACKHLEPKTGGEVSLVITGGLRVAEDFVKTLALGSMRLPCRTLPCRLSVALLRSCVNRTIAPWVSRPESLSCRPCSTYRVVRRNWLVTLVPVWN